MTFFQAAPAPVFFPSGSGSWFFFSSGNGSGSKEPKTPGSGSCLFSKRLQLRLLFFFFQAAPAPRSQKHPDRPAPAPQPWRTLYTSDFEMLTCSKLLFLKSSTYHYEILNLDCYDLFAKDLKKSQVKMLNPNL